MLTPDWELEADHVVALPRLKGPRIKGIPSDSQGFILTDGSGCVVGLEDVFAAGDATAFPVKQGGLAAQQADAAAEEIACLAGADVAAEPFQPVLRGLILTGGTPLYARAELSRAGLPASVATDELWILDPPSQFESISVEADLSSLAAAK